MIRKMTKHKRTIRLFEPELVGAAIRQSFVKLNPRYMVKNPVMFTVEIGTAVMLAVCIWQMITGNRTEGALWYNITVFAILLLLERTLALAEHPDQEPAPWRDWEGSSWPPSSRVERRPTDRCTSST